MARNRKRRRRDRNDPRRQEIQKQREEARRRVAEQRRAEAEAEEQRRERLALVRRFGLPVLAGLAVFTVALLLFRPLRELPAVQKFDPIESTPLAAGETFDYGTETPTSGPYLPGDPRCGVFTERISNEQAATAIYHGGVVLWHRPDLSDADAAALAEIVGDFGEVTLSPNPAIDEPVVATSWGRRRGYDGPGDDVREYIEVYRDRGEGEGTCQP